MINRISILACFILIQNLNLFAQSEGGLDLKAKGLGIIYNKNVPEGYYIYSDKSELDKKTEVSVLRILNLSMEESKAIQLTMPKKSEIVKVCSNGEVRLVHYLIGGTQPYFLTIDKDGKTVGKLEFEKLKREKAMPYLGAQVYSLGATGFILVVGTDMDRNFEVQAYSNELKPLYSFTGEEGKFLVQGNVVFADDNYIGMTVTAMESRMKPGEAFLEMYDSKTGKKVFKVQNEIGIIKKMIFDPETKTFDLTGDWVDEKSPVLYYIKLDEGGKKIISKKVSYATDIPKLRSLIADPKSGVVHHDMFKHDDGTWTVIGECYSYKGVKVTSKELVIIQLDRDFKYISSDVFQKEGREYEFVNPNSLPQMYSFYLYNAKGSMDYSYTAFDKQSNSYDVVYTLLKKNKSDYLKNDKTICSIHYDGKGFIEKKTNFTTEGNSLLFTPSEFGKAILWEYFDKGNRQTFKPIAID